MFKSSLIILSLFSLIIACQNKDREIEKVNIPIEAESTKEQHIKNLFVQKLDINMNENEVRKLFGGSFSLIRNAMEGSETWRYDLGIKHGYKFNDQGIDQVDIEGLKQGLIEQQLFIDWSKEGQVQSAALYMINDEQNGYFELYLLPDNTREEKFTPFQ